MPTTTAEALSFVTRNVSVAPLVLLSVADHFGRQAKGTKKRVVGVLLGQNDGKNARVSNSFAGLFLFSCLVSLAKWDSTIRRRRERSIGLVLGSQLCGKHERYVQEGQCSRKAHRVVS